MTDYNVGYKLTDIRSCL